MANYCLYYDNHKKLRAPLRKIKNTVPFRNIMDETCDNTENHDINCDKLTLHKI